MGDQAMGATQYVAFLRAINVGGRTAKMTDLKALFEKMKLREVQTFIASGNVIFTSPDRAPALEARIQTALEAGLGYHVVTMLRTTKEVAAATTFDAFPPDTLAGASLYIGFLKTRPAPSAVRNTLALQTDVDELRIHERAVYWLARKRIAESTITGATIERALQTAATFRNITTVRRLAAKYPPT